MVAVLAVVGSTGVALAFDSPAGRLPVTPSDPRPWRGFTVDLRGVARNIDAQRDVVVRTAPAESTVLVDFGGDGIVRFSVPRSGPALSGPTQGPVRLPANGADDVLAHVVNTRGLVEARSLVIHDGVARLLGGDTALASRP